MCSFNNSNDGILETIKRTLSEKKKSQKDLCKHLGLSQQTFSEWNAGRSASYKKYLPQIAEFLGVSVDYLLGKTDKKNKTASDERSLTEVEKELLSVTADMDEDEKNALLGYAARLIAKRKKED